VASIYHIAIKFMKPDTLPKMIESTKCDAAEVT